MFQQIAQILREWLIPYDDAIADLMARCEELERRLDNIIQPGVIAEVDEPGDKIKVAFANNQTPWIKPLFPRAGAVKEKSRLTVGEQVLLLNWAGGDNSSQCFALCGIYSSQHTAPTSNPDEHVIDWGNGLRLTVNTKNQTVNWQAQGGVTFDTPQLRGTGEVSDKVRNMSADRSIYDGHTHPNGVPNTLVPNQKQG